MTSHPFIPLVELLRAELAGYGGLLALFDEQQAQLWRREVQAVADTSLAIEQIAAETARHRLEREAWVARFATGKGQPAETNLRRLLEFFPADQQPLLGALIDEINHLLHRVRRRARQNHSILARAVELHRDALATLHPAARPRTYAPSGRIGSLAGPAATLQAAG
ncbi:MAG: flagellar export chaperone FlgN [Opitutus sp.]|nr:flagellar export chaperone FlgN [Opitutus sp.]MCS6247742.1 flagellar export chaperone FlgN [Opitutus sp.]MCS6274264.1 flagellar export chaperone FlgN [Opitutus sp.]MCS6277428.1 flagellar export chaperone FlgN [Opitutus sp.]MCS6300545.1 flagellar export chaperone FlgN [Opitutus sp.]